LTQKSIAAILLVRTKSGLYLNSVGAPTQWKTRSVRRVKTSAISRRSEAVMHQQGLLGFRRER